MDDEVWVRIPYFPSYEISNLGNVYNHNQDCFMRKSINNHGHTKITLRAEDGTRHTRSVGLLVAEAFVEKPNLHCDHIIVLDGDFSNVAAHNLAWRPRGFAWEYTHQLKVDQPRHYHNLPVVNIVSNVQYESIVSAGVNEGVLFNDIWRSTYTAAAIFPHGSIFEVIERV